MRKSKSVKKNAVLNVLKQCCNILFPLITYPYVSRVLGSTNYGKFSFSDNLVAIFMVIAGLGIPTYAVREGSRIRDDKEKISKFASEVFSINLIALLVTLIAFGLSITFVDRLHRDINLTFILGINIITSIIGRDWVNTIYEDFTYVTIRYISFQTIALILIFSFVHKPSDYIIYTWIMLLSNSGGYVLNFFYTRKYVPIKLTVHYNYKKHLKPILYLFGVSLAIQIYVRSDAVVLGFFRPDSDVGIYNLAAKVYTILKTLLNAIVVVAIPRLSNDIGGNKRQEYYSLLEKIRNVLYLIVFPCIVGLFFESRNVMLLIGGAEYESGYLPLRVLCFAMFFAIFGSFYSQCVLVPKRRDKIYFIATVVSAIVNIGLNITIIPYLGMAGAALTTIIAEAIVVSFCAYASKKERKNIKYSGTFSVVIGCIVIGVICAAVSHMNFNYILELFVSIVLSIVGYTATLYLLRNKLIREALSEARNFTHRNPK